MTETARRGIASARPSVADVVDAEFVTLEAPSPPPPDERRATARDEQALGILRPAASAASRGRRRGGTLFWVAGVGTSLVAFWVSGGHAAFHAWRQPDRTGGGFALRGIVSRVDGNGPQARIVVDGRASNIGVEPAAAPDLEIRVAGPDGRVTRYKLGTSGTIVPPGGALPFASRVHVPRSGVKTVTVAFAD